MPDLKHTMKWYLHSVQPLLTAQQFANTQKLAAAFMDGVGPELQRQLVERANAMSKTSWDSQHESCSWLVCSSARLVCMCCALTSLLVSVCGQEEWWNDLAYLSSRDSLLATNVFTTIHEGRPFHRPMERTAQAVQTSDSTSNSNPLSNLCSLHTTTTDFKLVDGQQDDHKREVKA